MTDQTTTPEELMTTETITLTAPHNITPEDAAYWAKRTIALLDNARIEIKPASRIYFDRSDWTHGLGVIYPGPDTFTIKGIEGHWLMTRNPNENDNAIEITEREDASRKYHGYSDHNCPETFYFAEMQCERENADPRIAFAQLMYNIQQMKNE